MNAVAVLVAAVFVGSLAFGLVVGAWLSRCDLDDRGPR